MRILSLPYNQILKEARDLDNDVKEIKSNIMKLCWYMRGGLTLDEGFATCAEDREIMNKIVEQNLETTKKTGLPFF